MLLRLPDGAAKSGSRHNDELVPTRGAVWFGKVPL
jgi:hypothetical protein